jgi:antitoxin component of MazEF toxin-antitoxin module
VYPGEAYYQIIHRRLKIKQGEKETATVQIKRVLKIGGSLAVILPRSWTRGKLKAGEELVLIANGELRLIPVHPKDEVAQK